MEIMGSVLIIIVALMVIFAVVGPVLLATTLINDLMSLVGQAMRRQVKDYETAGLGA